MTLADLVSDYRKKNNLSLRKFAEKCDVSHTHISMIEKSFNPKTNEPVIPSLPLLKKLANGMNMSLDELLITVDDFRVSLDQEVTIKNAPSVEDAKRKELFDLIVRLTPEQQQVVIALIKTLLKEK